MQFLFYFIFFLLQFGCNSIQEAASSASSRNLTLKAPITTAADDSLAYFFHCFSDKIMLDISCESSAWQRIHTKHQASFSSKDKSKNNKCVICCNFAWCFKG